MFTSQNDSKQDLTKKLKIYVKVVNYDEGYVYFWDMKKFSNRYFLIKDIMDNYFDTNELPNLKREDDPMWDPPESYFMG